MQLPEDVKQAMTSALQATGWTATLREAYDRLKVLLTMRPDTIDVVMESVRGNEGICGKFESMDEFEMTPAMSAEIEEKYDGYDDKHWDSE